MPSRPVLPTLVAVLLLVGACGEDDAAEDSGLAVSEVVTFGDSWSDAGTFGFVYGTTPGDSWPQLVAEAYGGTQAANRFVEFEANGETEAESRGGLNYAEGGALISPLWEDPADAPKPMTAQLATFLDNHGSFTSEQLVTVWGGSNDLLFFATGGDADEDRTARFLAGDLSSAEIEEATQEAAAAARREAELVGDILAADGQHVAVLNLIDLGITAQVAGTGPGGHAVAGQLTDAFNRELADALPDDPRVLLVDIAGLFADVEADPAEYGFEVVDGDACTNGGTSCSEEEWAAPDADRVYAFAALGHFTAATRELIADRVREAVEKRWAG